MAQETAAPVSIDQAFDAAADAQASVPVADDAEPETAVDSGEGDTDATDAQQPQETGTEPAAASEGSDELLSEEEYESLKDNPKALRKALNRAYTQQRQRMAPYERLITALERDPQGTARQLAEHYGVLTGQAAQPEQQAKQTGNDTAETVALLKQSLGPDYDFLAPLLAQPFETLVSKALEKHLGPVQQATTALQVERSIERTEAEFTKLRPDWRQYEKKMVELAQYVRPAEGVSEVKFYDMLYMQAKLPSTKAEQVKQVVQKQVKAAAAAESSTAGVPTNRVASKPGHKPSIEEAFEAAERGEMWEQ